MKPNPPHPKNNTPLVRIGQGQYAKDIRPSDLDAPAPNEGASVGFIILALIYLIIGFVLGAWLW